MSLNKAHKVALGFYNLAWGLAIPAFRMNQRLARGFEERMLQNVALTNADVWIQAASAGESKMAKAIPAQMRTV